MKGTPTIAASAAVALVAAALGATLAAAQNPPQPPDSAAAARDALARARAESLAVLQRTDSLLAQRRTRGDSVRPRAPISPTNAFFRSLLLPGWGQARLGRNVTGGLFVAFEGLAAAMVWKAQWQLDFARVRNKNVTAHRQEREDWMVLLFFNHLMAGAEAYVSAHLFDFPAALTIQPLPGGGAGVGIRVPLR